MGYYGGANRALDAILYANDTFGGACALSRPERAAFSLSFFRARARSESDHRRISLLVVASSSSASSSPGTFDWLIHGDDDTYFVLSSLVPFLRAVRADPRAEPLYLGKVRNARVAKGRARARRAALSFHSSLAETFALALSL